MKTTTTLRPWVKATIKGIKVAVVITAISLIFAVVTAHAFNKDTDAYKAQVDAWVENE